MEKPRHVGRRHWLKTMAAGGAIGVAGCVGGDDDEGTGDTITLALETEPDTLDLHEHARRPEGEVLWAIHETLFLINDDLEPEPHLASSYEYNDDQTEHVIQLEEGITFHNGEELTADLAEWNLNRFLENSPVAYLLDPATSIDATGEYELTLTFDDPFPLLPRYLCDQATGMVSREAVEDAGDDYGQSVIVGTGPYQFEEWDRAEHVRVTRYDEYDWGPSFAQNQEPSPVDEFVFRIIPEDTTLVQEVSTGDVHGSSYVPLSDATEVEESDEATVQRTEYTRPGFLAFNAQRDPSSDPTVRQALTHAIDREAVIDVVLDGEGYPIWSIVPPIAVNGLDEDRARDLGQEYDPDRARELLEEAGWTNDSEGEIRTRDGEPLELDFFAFTITRYAEMAEMIQPMFEDIGIDVNLEILEAGTLYTRLESSDHHIVTMAYGGNWAVNAMEPILRSDNDAREGGSNYSLWLNDEFDDFIDTAKHAADPEDRRVAMESAQELLLEEAPVAPILAFNRVFAHKEALVGIDDYTAHPWWPDEHLLRHLELEL